MWGICVTIVAVETTMQSVCVLELHVTVNCIKILTVAQQCICVTTVAVETTMHSVCVVELHVTVNCIKILTVVQQCIYDKFRSPATMKVTQVFV
jgi:hypothetical protein